MRSKVVRSILSPVIDLAHDPGASDHLRRRRLRRRESTGAGYCLVLFLVRLLREGHAEPRTTGLYDRRQKKVTRNIVERISVQRREVSFDPRVRKGGNFPLVATLSHAEGIAPAEQGNKR
jgi:hypothetical protein